MTHHRVQVVLVTTSGLPADFVVNTWHLYAPGPVDWGTTAVDPVFEAFKNFYSAIRPYLASTIPNVGHHIKVYDPALPLQTPPVRTYDMTLNGTIPSGGSPPMPAEVATCLTMKGIPAPGPGRHPQSWHGRVYLGPVDSSSTLGGSGRPAPSFINFVLTAAQTLHTQLVTAGQTLVIYSRKLHLLFPVSDIGMDDAWDTQRSRGPAPTTKNYQPLTGTIDATPIPVTA